MYKLINRNCNLEQYGYKKIFDEETVSFRYEKAIKKYGSPRIDIVIPLQPYMQMKPYFIYKYIKSSNGGTPYLYEGGKYIDDIRQYISEIE